MCARVFVFPHLTRFNPPPPLIFIVVSFLSFLLSPPPSVALAAPHFVPSAAFPPFLAPSRVELTPMSTSSHRLSRAYCAYCAYCRGHTISVFVERFPVKRGYVPKLRTEYAYSSRLLSAALVTSGLALGSKSM